jgi:hypothetical protein
MMVRVILFARSTKPGILNRALGEHGDRTLPTVPLRYSGGGSSGTALIARCVALRDMFTQNAVLIGRPSGHTTREKYRSENYKPRLVSMRNVQVR